METNSSITLEVTIPGLNRADITEEFLADLIAAVERGIDKEGYACEVELSQITHECLNLEVEDEQ